MTMVRHFLNGKDLSFDEIREILVLAKVLKEQQKQGIDHRLLFGKCLAMIFEKPSNRTRISFEVGMFQLGGHALNLLPSEIRMKEREPIADVSRVMSRYVDAVMMRVSRHADLEEFAEHSSVPVVNGLSDLYHPCQAMSDMLTIEEKKGSLPGLKLCYVGDGNNVCNSLITVCNIFGLEIVVSCPPGYEPSVLGSGAQCRIEHDAERAVSGADIVYTDVWVSMGQERESAKRRDDFRPYRVTEALFRRAASAAIFMHCLPAHRGEEVDAAVVESPASVIFDQAENRLHMQKAILATLIK